MAEFMLMTMLWMHQIRMQAWQKLKHLSIEKELPILKERDNGSHRFTAVNRMNVHADSLGTAVMDLVADQLAVAADKLKPTRACPGHL